MAHKLPQFFGAILTAVAIVVCCLAAVQASSSIGGVEQVTVREYDPVTLTCDHRLSSANAAAQRMTASQRFDADAAYYRGCTIRWLRNNVTISSAENVGRLSLDIEKASRYETGDFDCELLRNGKVLWHQVKRLRVAYAPIGAPLLLPESLSGHHFVPEGASVSLTCHLIGDPGWPPAVPVWRWRRGSEESGECCTGQREMTIKATYQKQPTSRLRSPFSKRSIGATLDRVFRKKRDAEDDSQSQGNAGESWSCFYKNEIGTTRHSTPRKFIVQPAVTVANYSYTKPTDQVAVEGDTVTFSCNVSNPAVVVHWNVRYENQGANDMNMLLTGGNGVLLRSHELSPRITSVGHLNLVIANVTREDEAVYICKVGSNPWAEAKLTVLVRPSEAKLTRISPPKDAVVRAGHRVTFNCSSNGGNPAPKLEWSRSNGVKFEPESLQQSDSVRFGTTWSTLSFHASPEDDNTDVICTVSHQLLSQPMRAVETLRVEYAPILSVNPPERLRARLGTTASVHCSAKANPPVSSLVWLRPGGPMGAGEHTLSRDGAYQFRVERSDSGTLICRASNSVGEKELAIGVEVLYPPELTVTKGPISVVEGTKAVLQCEAVASPSPSILRWRRVSDGTILTEVSDSSALVHAIEPISRHDAGVYTCEAKNTMVYPSAPGVSTKVESEEGADVKQVEINVLYPPGKAKITNGAIVTVAAGESVRLFCEVEDLGNPAGSVSWYRLPDGNSEASSINSRAAVGRSSGTTAELRMEGVTAERVAGLYECLAENKFGRGTSAIVTLVVNEQPRWINPLVNNQRPLWKAQDFTLACTAAGNPAPVLTWQRNGLSFSEMGGNSANSVQMPSTYSIQTSQPILKRGLYHVDSWLRFPRSGLGRNDSGQYSCKAENKLGVSSSQTTVTVLYPPVPITTFSKFSATVGRPARLRFLVYSASKPRFYWSMEGNHISNQSAPGRYYIIERGSDHREIFESILVINQVTASDFGLYTIRAENDQGRTGDTVLKLVEPSPPDAPTLLEATATNWDSGKLVWQPGFDGGASQSIEVLVYSGDSVDKTDKPFKSFTVQVKPSSAKLFGMLGLMEDGLYDEPNQINELSNEMNVTGLLPGSIYTVRLRGINQHGAGAFTEPSARFTTPNLTDPSDVFFNPLANALQFRPADSRLCVRVAKTVDGGRSWSWLDDCLGAGRGVITLGGWPTGAVAIAIQMCMIERPKTCTGLVSARARHFDPNSVGKGWSPFETLDEEGVSASSAFLSTPALILGVAAGIGATLILLLVSIVVVCKRRKAALRTAREGCNKDAVYSLCGRGGSGISSRGSDSSAGGIDDNSQKPVLLSAGSGGCYAAIDSVVSVQQHSGSGSSGVSGSSPLDLSELISHGAYHSSSAMIGAFSSIPQHSFVPHSSFHPHPAVQQPGWSQSSTASGSTESAVLHGVDDSGVVGEDLTAMLRRICSVNVAHQHHHQQQHDNHSIPSDHMSSSSNTMPLLSTNQGYSQQQLNACQTPDSHGQQRKVRYEVVV